MTDENYEDAAEGYFEGRNSRADRVAMTIARLNSHGSATHTALADSAESRAPGRNLKFNSASGTYSDGFGNSFTEEQMTREMGEGEVPVIPDNGVSTHAERLRLNSIIEDLDARLNKITGYDVAGVPQYVLADHERSQLITYRNNLAQQHAYAFDELAALDAQRTRRKVIADAVAAEDAAREERIDAETAAALERLEGEERARVILAARKKVVY